MLQELLLYCTSRTEMGKHKFHVFVERDCRVANVSFPSNMVIDTLPFDQLTEALAHLQPGVRKGWRMSSRN
jgi:hypothetical protein